MVYWFPWYPSRFKSETMHLKAVEDGIYRRLIDHYMETGKPLPNSPGALARIAGVSLNEFRRASAAVLAFFDVGDDGALHQGRCDKVLQGQADRRESLSERGHKGGRPPKEKPQESYSLAIAKPQESYSFPIAKLQESYSKANEKLTKTTSHHITEQDIKDHDLERVQGTRNRWEGDSQRA